MISLFLIFVLLLVIFISLLVGWAISLHFRRFGLPGDPSFKRIFNIFKIGSIILIGLGALLLILNLLG